MGGTVSRDKNQCLNNQAHAQLKSTIARYLTPKFSKIVMWVENLLFGDLMLKG